jgi:hypothetical protein
VRIVYFGGNPINPIWVIVGAMLPPTAILNGLLLATMRSVASSSTVPVNYDFKVLLIGVIMKNIIVLVGVCLYGIVMWLIGYWAGASRRIEEEVFRGD